MVTMRDVALLAGVSVSTVSHVLNGTRNVNPDTRERVLSAVDALGYRPNIMARSLRRKDIPLVGLVVPDATNPYFAEVARAVEDRCYQLGLSIMMASSAGHPDRERRAVEAMTSHRVGGMIIVGLGFPEGQARALAGLEIPVVMVDRKISGLPVDSVQSDNHGGGSMAARHLLDLGHRRMGCICGPRDIGPSRDRLRGFQEALSKSGITIDPDMVTWGDFSCPSGYELAREMLLRHRPTAIFAMNDLMAFGALRVAAELGFSVPGDLSVVGFDGISIGQFFSPPLSTVAQPIGEMGAAAVDLLWDRIGGNRFEPVSRVIDCSMLQRSSTGPAKP